MNSALVLSSPTIRTIHSLQAELAERLDESGHVQIDGTSVDRVDTAGLQLLAAFVRDLHAEMRWVSAATNNNTGHGNGSRSRTISQFVL